LSVVVAAALLLDIGHVVLEPSWPAVRAYEAATGTPMPQPEDVAVAQDHGWQAAGNGDTVGDRYWDEVAELAGLGGMLELFRTLGTVVPDAIFVLDAVALMDDTRAAGMPVGILTNHAYMLLGRDWFAARPEFAGLATFVDAAEIGCPKPDPQAYLTAAREMGVPPGDVVFLDDTPDCIDGALRVGMLGVRVDPANRLVAFTEARRLLGLG
jgi:phosphoglycolate phosphatase-like HAD superfamily hydrolase